jgi:hypothetical protein
MTRAFVSSATGVVPHGAGFADLSWRSAPNGARHFRTAEPNTLRGKFAIDNDVGRLGQQLTQIVAQLESANDDGLRHLLGKTSESLNLIVWLAKLGDSRMKAVLPHVRAMARAIERLDKGKAIKAGNAAVTEFGTGGSSQSPSG